MENKISKLFAKCASDPDVSQIADLNIKSYTAKLDENSFDVYVQPEKYISRTLLRNCETAVRNEYNLRSARIIPEYSAEMFTLDAMDDLVAELRRDVPTVNGSLNHCCWSVDSEKDENGYERVVCQLDIDTRVILRARDFEKKLADLIRSKFGKLVTVELRYEPHEPTASVYREPEVVVNDYTPQPAAPAAQDNAPTQTQKAEKPAVKNHKPASAVFYGIPSDLFDPETILGKVDSKMRYVKISDLNPEYTEACIYGKVFGFTSKLARNERTLIVSFNITDKTSSCTVKLFANKTQADKVEQIKDGVTVVVQGKYEEDSYEKQYVLKANSVTLVSVDERRDNAKEKRVELHMHTTMSAKDAVSTVEDIVRRAANWGHKAIAITDHAVAQAYPGAMNTAMKCAKDGKPIKVIYGVEAYYVDDMCSIVKGEKDYPLDTEYIVFDFETTGLSSVNDRITEIGAVRIKNGEITDTYCEFVNPGMPIPAKVVELTGITDAMVRNAPDESVAVPAFLEFIGEDAVLVAHNADFDYGFLTSACERLGIEFSRTYLDTVALSRALHPEARNHKLDTIVKLLDLPDFEHHRAKDDAYALALVYQKQMQILKEDFSISTLLEINTAVKGGDAKKLRDHHQIILVKNLVGLKNLYKLISWAHVDNFYKHPRILKSQLMAHREGLILGSACEAGELYKAVRDKKRWSELCEIASMYDYLEIQPLCNNEFMLRKGIVQDRSELISINRTIVKLGEKLGKPVVATCDAHYLDEDMDIFRRILLSNKGMDDANDPAKLFFRTTEEMLREFEYLGKDKAYEVVVTNSNLIADMTDEIRPIPEGVYPPRIEGSDDMLIEITQNRAREIYGDPLPEYVAARLDRELTSINKHGFSIMYITAQKLVADSVEHGYLVGSRGSVGSSFVATMAGISEVNPLAPHYVCPECKYSEFFINDQSIGSGFDLPAKDCPKCGAKLDRDGQDIPFETFLGFDGDKQPDIDLNFSGEYQSSAHKFTETMFGKQNVFKAGTIGTVKEKTAFSYVSSYAEKYGIQLPRAEVERLKLGIVGTKSTTGQHPGGMVVVPQDNEVYDFCPYQHPADKTTSDVLTTHFDFHSIHDTILKLDILGHDVPTIYKYLEEFTGISVMKVSMSDEKVMSLFESPAALGVESDDIESLTGTLSLPELGTDFVRGMLIDTKPRTFSDLLQISGLSHGTGVYIGNAKDLIDNNVCTISDVIGTRDNIMTYLIKKGMPEKMSFKIMEIVRKGNAKKLLTDEHISEMKKHGVPQWYIDSCFKIEYMFPKAHACAYMIAALRLGWYKVYKPAAYYAAYFTARVEEFDAESAVLGVEKARGKIAELRAKGNDMSKTEEDTIASVQIVVEALCRKIVFKKVDLYQSHATKFIPLSDTEILLPFIALKGLGAAAAENLYQAGKQGPYISRDEVGVRAEVSKGILEILTSCGAMDSLPDSAQISLFE